jgi:hypothetical protein
MKPIKVTKENEAAIESALAAINGRASAFAITGYWEVWKVADAAESHLSALPKAERVGAVAVHVPDGPAAKAYKYRAASTRLSLERRATGWFLTEIERTEVYPGTSGYLRLSITQAQADEIARRAVAGFRILTDA